MLISMVSSACALLLLTTSVVKARDAHDKRSVVGNSCTKSGQCQLLDPNSQCDLVNGVCDCQEGLIAVRGRCQETSELGQRCTKSTQCLTPNTVCKQNYCACRTGLVGVNGECVKHLPELPVAAAISGGETLKTPAVRCKSDHECPTNYCLLNRCICPPGTLPLSNRDCGNVLSMPCSSAGQCRAMLPGSVCDVSLTRTCVCNDGFVAANEGRHCIRVLGSNCKTTRDCATVVRNSECKEVADGQRMECACISGMRPNFLDPLDGQTRCQEAIGAPCTVDVQCKGYVNYASCPNSTCACDKNFQYDPVTMTCVAAQQIARLFLSPADDNDINSNIAERLSISISGAIQINTDSDMPSTVHGQVTDTGDGSGVGKAGRQPPKVTNTGVTITDPSKPCTFPDRLQGCIGSRCLFEGFSCDADNSMCKKIASSNMYQCVCLPGFQSNDPLSCTQSTSGGDAGGTRGGGGTGGQGGAFCPQQTQACPVCPSQTDPFASVVPPAMTTGSPFPTPVPFTAQPRCGISPAGIDPFGLGGQQLTQRGEVHFNDSNLVVGGTDVSVNEICWQVGLQNNKGGGRYSLCGGSIIGDSWILTAGHCVVEGDTANDQQAAARDLFVVIGSLTNEPGEDPTGSSCSTRIRASRVIVHPGYQVQKDAGGNFLGIYNDITLIQLEKPVGLATSACACKMCLANKLPAPGEVGVISGYGCQTSDCSDQGSFQPRKLQYARLAFVPDTSPSCFGTSTSEFSKDYICVGGKFGVDACPGDSGGPFAAYDQRQSVHYQVGVASFVVGSSDSICAAGNPARYTKVPHYLSWIQQYVPDLQIIQ